MLINIKGAVFPDGPRFFYELLKVLIWLMHVLTNGYR